MARPPPPGVRPLDIAAPSRAQVAQIAPGIAWARLPLPFRLNHVNIWLLDDDRGLAAVDAGIDSPDMRDIWRTLLDGRRLTRLIATHGHSDHVGLAGFLADGVEVPFYGTLTEWLWARLRYAEVQINERPETQSFLVAHGCDASTLKQMASGRSLFASTLGPMPRVLTRIRDGDVLRIGDVDWLTMVGEGHAEEHASFYCEAKGVLIAGDQILSHISPMIGVFQGEPEADPLADYLRTIRPFADLPADTLVLPSHGVPFRGLRERVAWLADHHYERLGQFHALFNGPKSAFAAARERFPTAMVDGGAFMAISETLSHLHRLVAGGHLERWCEPDGKILFAPGPKSWP